ncbi:MAG: hypothetical protein U0324_13845 [Polyangiales bacterium]
MEPVDLWHRAVIGAALGLSCAAGCAAAWQEVRAIGGVGVAQQAPQAPTPPAAPPPTPVRAAGIAAGPYHTCAWGEGVVRCWGPACGRALRGLSRACSHDGQPLRDVAQLTWTESDAGVVGELCALRGDGSVWCWSADDDPDRPTRRALPPVTRIAAGSSDTCALLASGRVRCWGRAPLGDAVNEFEAPVAGATSLEARADVACAGARGGAFSCWRAQHADASPLDVARGADAVVIGQEHSYVDASLRYGLRTLDEGGTWCVLRAGAPSCWGANREATVGDGTASPRDRPVPVAFEDGPPLGEVVSLAIGLNRACAATRDGSVACWGSLGGGPSAPRSRARPQWVTGPRGVVEVVAGYNHACARGGDGAVWCWGANRGGVLGAGAASRDEDEPVPLAR